jgi:hypothetical protein
MKYCFKNFFFIDAGAYILENTPGGGGISADVIWGKKYEKAMRKKGKL